MLLLALLGVIGAAITIELALHITPASATLAVATTGVLATLYNHWILTLTGVAAVFVDLKAIHTIERAEDGLTFR